MGQTAQVGVSGPWTDWFWNALPISWGGKVLTADQIAVINEQNAKDRVKASGGTLSMDEARKQAAADTASIIADAKARAESDFNKYLAWGAIGLGAVAVILIIKD